MIQALWKNKKVVVFYYLLSLLSALMVAVPFYRTLQEGSGYSLATEALVKDFDFMIFTDTLRVLSENLLPFIPQLLLLAGITALAGIFFSGGVIDAVMNDRFRVRRFFIFSARFLNRMLMLGMILGALALLSACIAVLISWLMMKLIPAPDHREAVLLHVPAVIFFLLCLAGLFLLWDYSRVILVSRREKSIFGALAGAFRLLSRPRRPLLFFLYVLAAGLAGRGLYLLPDHLIGMTSPLKMILMIIIQQAYIFYRIFIRLLHIRLAGSVKTATPM